MQAMLSRAYQDEHNLLHRREAALANQPTSDAVALGSVGPAADEAAPLAISPFVLWQVARVSEAELIHARIINGTTPLRVAEADRVNAARRLPHRNTTYRVERGRLLHCLWLQGTRTFNY
jgi:hypothetical protein